MKNILAGLVLLLSAAPAWAALDVIELRHRSAEEVLPVIRPLLEEGEAASGMNYRLILRASPRSIGQIRKVLEEIDVAPRRLKITVMQDVDRETAARLSGVSGSVGVGRDARVTVPDSGGSGLNVEIGQGRDRLGARVDSTRSVEDERNTQRLQVLEGSRAFVRSGQSVPVPQRQVIQGPWGTRVIESTQYQEAGKGFYVLPRVRGDLVTLEIGTEDEAFVPGGGDQPAMRTQRTSSTVSGRLGEWLEVGGTGEQKDGRDTTISTRDVSGTRERRSILIRVEEAE